jgi:cell division topological specificity factor
MKLFHRSRQASAIIARERLQILLSHERGARSRKPDLLDILHEEILAAITRHVPFEPDKVRIKIGGGRSLATLAIDIEIPNGVQAPSTPAERAGAPFNSGNEPNCSSMHARTT